MDIDKDGNRSINRKELESFVANSEETELLLSIADSNNSGTLTFAELAWAIKSLQG